LLAPAKLKMSLGSCIEEATTASTCRPSSEGQEPRKWHGLLSQGVPPAGRTSLGSNTRSRRGSVLETCSTSTHGEARGTKGAACGLSPRFSPMITLAAVCAVASSDLHAAGQTLQRSKLPAASDEGQKTWQST
jgi:hypothetical protein